MKRKKCWSHKFCPTSETSLLLLLGSHIFHTHPRRFYHCGLFSLTCWHPATTCMSFSKDHIILWISLVYVFSRLVSWPKYKYLDKILLTRPCDWSYSLMRKTGEGCFSSLSLLIFFSAFWTRPRFWGVCRGLGSYSRQCSQDHKVLRIDPESPTCKVSAHTTELSFWPPQTHLFWGEIKFILENSIWQVYNFHECKYQSVSNFRPLVPASQDDGVIFSMAFTLVY